MSVPASAILAEAWRFAGQRYVFGAEGDLKPATWVGPVDCSELVQIACKRAGVTPTMPDGAYWQWRHTAALRIPVDQARTTPGALMFVGDGTGTGRDAITHVGLSLGDGRTFEARGSAWPVGLFTQRNGWTYAALIPGVNHTNEVPAMPTKTEATKIVDDAYAEILKRPADLSGGAYWVAELVAGRLNEGEFRATLKGFLDAEQTERLAGLEHRVTALENRPAGGTAAPFTGGTFTIAPA